MRAAGGSVRLASFGSLQGPQAPSQPHGILGQHKELTHHLLPFPPALETFAPKGGACREQSNFCS